MCVPVRATAKAPLPNRLPPPPHHSMNGACVRLLTTVTTCIPRERNKNDINPFLYGFVLLRTASRPGKQEAFLGAMHGRCRGLPVSP